MPDGPYMTPDEGRLMRMLLESGSPADAARDLISRLEELEAAVDQLEAAQASPEEPSSTEDNPSEEGA